ncbi:hypothetical protein C2G38_2186759 [Gigaspora rosea]|uniref:Uncharacterized protein n=1 Tax=Gigaspora rosea TaxID=44941 RepID=A0A397V5E7_9GLOM|nr:hypothetical protein C2G38_2186759 [Gigaspora rosea]
MSSLGYLSCAKTVDMYQKKVQKEHSAKIEHYFLEHNNFHVYNIDDYHSIHENHRPDMVSTSTANHFATCVAKPIVGCSSVPLVFNGASIHNPANIEASRERKEERSIKGLQLLGFKEQGLHGPLHVSLNSREQVLMIYHSFFEKLFHYVFGENKVLAKKPRPWRINLLLELVRNVPATLDVYAILFRSGQFNEYVEAIFRIWTFALRWKRKNYNKAPLVFLSDHFFQDIFNNHGRSIPKLQKKKNPPTTYYLATLNKDIELRHLPTAYSTAHPSRPELCDSCGRLLVNNNSMVFVCYHIDCYRGKCTHCEEFYKKGIFKNVRKFLNQIEKGEDKLNKEK